MFRKLSLILAVLIGLPSLSIAQATIGSRAEWTQESTNLATAQGYTYKYYINASTVGIAFTIVTCAGTVSPFTCSSLLPALTPGSYTLSLTASSGSVESTKSNVVSFSYAVVLPPQGLRIIP